jgi:hypothetical protein
MRNLIGIGILLVFLTCGSNKVATSSNLHEIITSTNCPKDGVCTFEVFQNKILYIKEDEIGALYPELSEGKKTVIKFEYKRDEIPNTADSSYSEIIYVEIDSDTKELSLKNEALKEAKVLFGRLCFCRGATGYYPISEGLLEVSSNKDGSKTYELTFKVYEVPQIITMFKETL